MRTHLGPMALERVDTPDDPRLAPYRDLRVRETRNRDGLFVAETRAVVRQLLAGGRFGVHSVLLTDPARAALADALARRPGVPVYLAALPVLKAVVGFDFHRGCLALGVRGRETSVDDVLAGAQRRLVLLEDVGNPDNVGGVLRAARALAASGALLSPACCDPLYRKAIRVSLGAALHLPWARVADWDAALARVRAAGFTLIALHPHDGCDVAAIPVPARAALLLGAEGAGLRAATRMAADITVRIPMADGVDSLNVATACAIALERLGGARR
jgi:tRNA G18 (ribose-2'-O)-methylase SpoU